MSSLMFYKNIVPLDKKKHKDLKLVRNAGLGFASKSNSVAVAGFEFFEASRNYPIFFIKNKDGAFVPLAILSLRKDGHELGDENWSDVYIPAYVRRYPFMMANDGVIVIDDESSHLSETEGEPLFGEDGEPSEQLKGLIEFLNVADRGFRQTEEFCKAVAAKELFKKFEGKVTFGQNGSINMGDVYAIDEKKMHESLNEAEVYEWFNKGWIAWAHAHLHSVGSLSEVIKRAIAASAEENAAAQAAEEAGSEQEA